MLKWSQIICLSIIGIKNKSERPTEQPKIIEIIKNDINPYVLILVNDECIFYFVYWFNSFTIY